MFEHLGDFGACWGSNPLPSGSGPATSPTGPGRTPFCPGGGRLDHPGAPGTGAPLCCGVRDPLGPHHHLSPLCVGVRDPLVPQHRSPPFVMMWAAFAPAKLTFPLPLAALAASPYLPGLLGTDLPRRPASGRPSAPRTAGARLDVAGLVPSRPTRTCLGTFLE